MKAEPKLSFLNDTDYNVLAGNARWAEWFPDATDAKMSTNCFVTSSSAAAAAAEAVTVVTLS